MPQQDFWDIAASTDGHPQNQPQTTTAQTGDIFDQAAAWTPVDESAQWKPVDEDWFTRNAPDAVQVANRPRLQQPVPVKSSIADRLAGALAPRNVPRGKPSMSESMPGFEGSYSSGDTDKGAFTTGAGVTALAALGGAAAAPRTIAAAKALGEWVSANPVKAYLAYEAVKDMLPKSIHGLFQAAKKSGD